jgi:hypothetical protein
MRNGKRCQYGGSSPSHAIIDDPGSLDRETSRLRYRAQVDAARPVTGGTTGRQNREADASQYGEFMWSFQVILVQTDEVTECYREFHVLGHIKWVKTKCVLEPNDNKCETK